MKCIYDGVIKNTPLDECQGVVFVEPHDIVNYQQWQFDEPLFSLILGSLLATFIGGHVLGRVLRHLGKY